MTRFTVTWLRSAEDRLADLWTASTNRQAITDATNAIDRELAVDAHIKGSPVSEGLRGLHIPPLHILFEVRELDRIVEVASVRMDTAPPASSQNQGNGQTTA
jgi:hypothetical protein